ALARDAHRELEPEAARIRDAGERADSQMLSIRLAALGDGELVPQVERGGRAVEARADVRRRGGRADPHRVRQARTWTIESTSTSTISEAIRSTASGSLSPCPVITATTVPEAPTLR